MASDDGESIVKIKAIAPWFGGKRTLAPKIIAELGPHKAYWEPFCGSCAVLMAKPECPMETVNDLHGDLVNLARVLASDRYAELWERSHRTLMCDQIFLECREAVATPADPAPSVDEVAAEHVLRAWRYLVCSWMGRNGAGGTGLTNITLAARYTSNGGSGGFRWRSAVGSIPAWHERLHAVHIRRMDAIEMVGKIEDSAASAIYVDPPYLTKSTKYVHDLESEDHHRLAEQLARFQKTRVVVSYYDDPRLEGLYPQDRWTKVACPVVKGLVNQSMRDQRGGKKLAPEVLLLNGPSYADQEGRLF
jgi:DNA adenine methylase